MKPTEQLLLPADGFQIIEPARIVQSQAERDVQPASYSVFGVDAVDQRDAGLLGGVRSTSACCAGVTAMTKRLFAVSMPP